MSDTNNAWRLHGDMPDLDMMLGLSELTQEELQDRRDRLQTIVPLRIYGDGLETYEDYIDPQHAETEEMSKAARELSLIRGILGEARPMRNNGLAIVVPIEIHQKHSSTYAGHNTGVLVELDAENPFAAQKRGREAYEETR